MTVSSLGAAKRLRLRPSHFPNASLKGEQRLPFAAGMFVAVPTKPPRAKAPGDWQRDLAASVPIKAPSQEKTGLDFLLRGNAATAKPARWRNMWTQGRVGYLGTLPLCAFVSTIGGDHRVVALREGPSTTGVFPDCAYWSLAMAKLLLKFDDQVIQEVYLSVGAITIGRQPDNVLRIDNPAVSGYHAKVYLEGNHYVLEDAESFNGTYVNRQRITKVVLKGGDKALIGKHTLEFCDEGRPGVIYGSASTVDRKAHGTQAKPPQ